MLILTNFLSVCSRITQSDSMDSLEKAIQSANSNQNNNNNNNNKNNNNNTENDVKGTPITTLLRDPHILCVAGALTIANFPLAFIEPMIGKYMRENFGSSEATIGMVWLPSWLPHLAGVAVTVVMAERFKQFQWFYRVVLENSRKWGKVT